MKEHSKNCYICLKDGHIARDCSKRLDSGRMPPFTQAAEDPGPARGTEVVTGTTGRMAEEGILVADPVQGGVTTGDAPGHVPIVRTIDLYKLMKSFRSSLADMRSMSIDDKKSQLYIMICSFNLSSEWRDII